MNYPTLSAIIIVTLSACGQSPEKGKYAIETKSNAKDTTTIFRYISAEACDCISSTMRNSKPITTFDSCYQSIVLKYEDSLKTLGFDPTTERGHLKLLNEVTGKFDINCPDIYNLITKQSIDENAKKLIFKGELVSQKRLPSGLFEVVLKNATAKEVKTFYTVIPVDEEQIKKYEPGYELTVEYEIHKNKATNKKEYYVKESGGISSIGTVKVANQ